MGGRSLRLDLPNEVAPAIEQIARGTGRTVAGVANEMLVEAVKIRQIPGVVFADESGRREAKVGGTGLGVWEVIEGYLSAGENWERFKAAYDWLSDYQLRAALAYWKAFPREIDAAIAENQSWTQEKIWATYPATKPPREKVSEASDRHTQA